MTCCQACCDTRVLLTLIRLSQHLELIFTKLSVSDDITHLTFPLNQEVIFHSDHRIYPRQFRGVGFWLG